MNNVISFTPAGLIAFITAIGGAAAAIGTVVALIYKLFKKLREPEDKQNAEIAELKKEIATLKKTTETFAQYFINDDNRFKALEDSNKITQNALLALLKHAINGNDLQQLKEAETRLENYLVQK
jgi:hypothetical protein